MDHEARKRAHTEAERRRRARRKALGLCISCSEPAAEGHATCLRCHSRHRSHRMKLRQRYREQGLCFSCGQTAPDGRTLCEKCIIRDKENHIRRVSQYTYRIGSFQGEIPKRNDSKEHRRRDQRVRGLASRLGYVLRRCRLRHPGIFWSGTYGLRKEDGDLVMGDPNHGYGMQLEAIERFLQDRLKIIEWRRENGSQGTAKQILHHGT